MPITALGDRREPPGEVAKIRREIKGFFDQKGDNGWRIGAAVGIYAFYDYDGEPIYVGQTLDSLSSRVGRHLTGRRSDAVGKFVLDPFEVLEVEVWPLWNLDLAAIDKKQRKAAVDPYEYTVYARLRAESRFGAVLNEDAIRETAEVTLPDSHRGRIIPPDLYEERRHPDIRLARRAQTVANLARLISERKVGPGLRQVLDIQAKRIAWLADKRLEDFR